MKCVCVCIYIYIYIYIYIHVICHLALKIMKNMRLISHSLFKFTCCIWGAGIMIDRLTSFTSFYSLSPTAKWLTIKIKPRKAFQRFNVPKMAFTLNLYDVSYDRVTHDLYICFPLKIKQNRFTEPSRMLEYEIF